MKVLLDECLPLDLRHHIPNHEVHTVQWAGLKGMKNGELLRAAEALGYDALLTVDQGISHQQPTSGRRIAMLVLHARTNQLEDLTPLVAAILTALSTIQPGQQVALG